MTLTTFSTRILPAFGLTLLAATYLEAWQLSNESGVVRTEAVQALQSAFQAERAQAVKRGDDKRFPSAFLAEADRTVVRAEQALTAGQLRQAEALSRQARWQLPYSTPELPDGVLRVFGSLRLRHNGEVTCLSLSPDRRFLATGSRDTTVKVWDLANGHEVCTFRGHSEAVRTVAFRSDGKQIASAGSDKSIRLWDPQSRKPIRDIPYAGKFLTRLVYHPDGTSLIVGGDDRKLHVYRVSDGEELAAALDLRHLISSLGLSQDGKLLVAGSGDGSFRVWHTDQRIAGQPAFWEHNDTTEPTVDVAISPDKRKLARCSAREAKLYELPVPGRPFGVPTRLTITNPDPSSAFTCAAYHLNGKMLYTGASDGLIHVWDAETGKRIGTLKGHSAAVHALRFDPSGLWLYSASGDHTVRRWPMEVSTQSREYLGHTGPVWSVRFSPDGTRLVSASADKSVRLWDSLTSKEERTLKGPGGPLTSAVYSPDGKYVAAGGGEAKVFVWRADTGALLHTLEGHASTVTSLAFNADGSRFASAGADLKILLWDTDGFKKTRTLDAPAVVTSLAFLPDGSRAVSGDVDAEIRLWDVMTGEVVARWQGHAGSINGLSVSDDGRFLASAGGDQLIHVWDLRMPGNTPRTLKGHIGPVAAVAFHKDGRHVASAGADRLVKLWRLDDSGGKEIQTYQGHKDYVSSVAFSPDGHSLVTASADKSIRLWEITSRESPALAEHSGSVEVVVVSPDGKTIVSGAGDRTIRCWDLETGSAKHTLTGHTGKLTALTITADGKRLFSSATDRTLHAWDFERAEPLPLTAAQQADFAKLLNPARALGTTPDGKRLLAWVPGNERFTTLKSFDPETGKELFSYSDTGRNVLSVCFSTDGKRAAVGAQDGSVRVIDLDLLQPIPGGDWFLFDTAVGVRSLAFDTERRVLYVGGDNGEVKAVTLADRKVTRTWKAHEGQVRSCVVSPDGKRLATAGADHVVKLWDLPGCTHARSWRMQPAGTKDGEFVRNLAFTSSGDLVTANANTTLYLLQGK
jgi:WD40 repeat protein